MWLREVIYNYYGRVVYWTLTLTLALKKKKEKFCDSDLCFNRIVLFELTCLCFDQEENNPTWWNIYLNSI